MRRIVLFGVFLLSVFEMRAQHYVIGFVYDHEEVPFIGVPVELKFLSGNQKWETYTDAYGRFQFRDLEKGKYHLLVATGYGLISREFNLQTSLEFSLQRPRTIRTDEVVVKAVRAEEGAPVTHTNLDKEEIDEKNLGQDVPFLLKWTPSTVATSDAGTGIGYTGIRIRGTDPTRINVTINGVPLNDAESHAVFWVDLPDFLSTVESIQIQRGVGSSAFGGGNFGASINLNTTKTHLDPYLQVASSAGSFNTLKGSLQFASGLLGRHFTIDGRASYISSDGFIDRARADLKSFYTSAAYIGKSSSLRLNVFSGQEETYQAWYGVPAQYIDDPERRTFNIAGTERPGEPYENEVDDYTQTHVQLLYHARIATQINTQLTLHYTRGRGFFEQYKSVEGFEPDFLPFLEEYGLNTGDLVRRRWLDNDFFGAIGSIHYTDPGDRYTLTLGGGYHKYLGTHFGDIIWSETDIDPGNIPNYYDNDADKRDGSLFLKLNYDLTQNLMAYGDLQWRRVDYRFLGIADNGQPLEHDVAFSFFNPKFGLTYALNDAQAFYYTFGIAQREPNRDDFVEAPPQNWPSSEKLWNHELGYRLNGKRFGLQLNFYHMSYRDQLVLTGQINDVGAYTRRNIPDSYRFGIETNARVSVTSRLMASASATLSRNKIRRFEEYIDNWDYWDQDFTLPPDQLEPQQFVVQHEDTDLAFSPEAVLSGGLSYAVLSGDALQLDVEILGKHVSRQFTDNTSNTQTSLPAFTYFDAQLTMSLPMKKGREIRGTVLLRNLFDAQYITNAWVYRFRSENFDPRPDDPYSVLEGNNIYHQTGFFPQAGRNVLVGLTFRL